MNIKNLLIALCLMLGSAVGANAQCAFASNIDYKVFLAGTEVDNGWVEITGAIELADLNGFAIDLSDEKVKITANADFISKGNLTFAFGWAPADNPGFLEAILSAGATIDGVIISTTANGFNITIPAGTPVLAGQMAMADLVFNGCTPVPSMGQWGLFILGLLMTSLAVVKIRNAQFA